MAKKIIDDVKELMNMSDDDVREILSDSKYNKANLSELVRRTLKVANEYKKAYEYEKYDRKETEEILRLYEGKKMIEKDEEGC